MPKFWVNDLGTIREAVKVFANDAGTVRELTKLWALDGTTPRLVFELVQGIQPIPGAVVNGNANAQQNCISAWSVPEDSIVFVPADFWLWSDDTAEPGLCIDVDGVTVINAGNIIGRGGDAGADGGPALEIDACGVTVINNSGAFIAGGGGGGGFRTTNLGRGWSVGGGGGAGGGRGGNGSQSSAGVTGGAIGAGGGQGAEAGGQPGAGQQGAGGGGGRILPGTATVGGSGSGGAGGEDGTIGGGGGWGADGGASTGTAGVGGPAIISHRIWNGVTDSGTIFGQVAPLIGSDVPIGRLFHHQELTLSSLCVNDGDTVTFPENFFLWSDDISVPALTIDVPNVTIINNGSIIGRGGDGGSGSGVGTDGGPAINVTATGVTVNNTSTGFIAGGGGGGRGRVVNRGRGTSNGGGGGAGGGRGGAGTSSNSFTISFGGPIGQVSSGGAETGGGGNSGTNYGAGGGRVTPGAAYTAVAGGGGGWGEPGLDTNGAEHTQPGASFTGQTATIINNGDIRGGIANSLSGSFSNSGAQQANGGIITIPFTGTVPAGATWTINLSSGGNSDPLKTGILRFDGVEVARFSAGAGGTPGSFCRTNSYNGTGTITGGPYTPTTVTFQVDGVATSLVSLPCIASIGGSISVTWLEDVTGIIVPASFPATPNLINATASTTVDISSIAADAYILGYMVGGGGGGAESNGDPDAEAGGGGGGATIFIARRSDFTGNSLTVTVGAGGAGAFADPGSAIASTGGASSVSDGSTIFTAAGGGGARSFTASETDPAGTRSGGSSGAGSFTWITSSGTTNTQGEGTSSTITGILDSLSGGLGGVTTPGTRTNGGSVTWGGGGGAGQNFGSSTNAGTSGRGGSSRQTGNTGFVRLWTI